MKKRILPFALIAALSLSGCGNAGENKREEDMPVADRTNGVSAMTSDSSQSGLAYVCPCGGCPEVRESGPGNCPKCEMELVKEDK